MRRRCSQILAIAAFVAVSGAATAEATDVYGPACDVTGKFHVRESYQDSKFPDDPAGIRRPTIFYMDVGQCSLSAGEEQCLNGGAHFLGLGNGWDECNDQSFAGTFGLAATADAGTWVSKGTGKQADGTQCQYPTDPHTCDDPFRIPCFGYIVCSNVSVGVGGSLDVGVASPTMSCEIRLEKNADGFDNLGPSDERATVVVEHYQSTQSTQAACEAGQRFTMDLRGTFVGANLIEGDLR